MDDEQSNLCEMCGTWARCGRGFARWPDQEACGYAIKSPYRDQCRYTSESGGCINDEARIGALRTEARETQGE